MYWNRLAVEAWSAAVSPGEVRGKRGEAHSHNYNLTSSPLIPLHHPPLRPKLFF